MHGNRIGAITLHTGTTYKSSRHFNSLSVMSDLFLLSQQFYLVATPLINHVHVRITTNGVCRHSSYILCLKITFPINK